MSITWETKKPVVSADHYGALGRLDSITSDEDTRRFVDAWVNEMERTCRALAGDQGVTTTIGNVPGGFAAACTEDRKIILNSKEIQAEVVDYRSTGDMRSLAARLKGLVYHELAHARLTPFHSPLVDKLLALRKQTSDPMWWFSFNILEDQRIETQTVTEWRPQAWYFRAAIYRWVLRNTDSHEGHMAWLYLHGRHHVPDKLVAKCRKEAEVFFGEDVVLEFEKVIDEYVTLDLLDTNLVTSTGRAYELVERFHSLLAKTGEVGSFMSMPFPSGGHGSSGEEQPIGSDGISGPSAEQQGALAKASARAAKAVADAMEQADGRPGKASTTNTDDDTAPGTGVSNEDTEPDAEGSFFDDLQKALSDILDDPKLGKDLDNSIDAVRRTFDSMAYDLKHQTRCGRRQNSVGPADLVAYQGVVNVLAELKHEIEPEWMRREPVGRVDPYRFRTAPIGDMNVFDYYDVGDEDAGDTEVVILIDRSVSMGGAPIAEASRAAWVIKHAFDRIDIPVTVLLYDTSNYVGYEAQEKVEPTKYDHFSVGGSTHPQRSLRIARRILDQSDASHKFCVILTDGQWGGASGTNEDEIDGMGAIGITTVLFGLNNAVRTYGKHACQVAGDIGSPYEMVRIVRDMVAESLAHLRR